MWFQVLVCLLLSGHEVFVHGQAFSPQEQTDLVNEHNTARANVNPPATDMLTIVWDTQLQNISQNWADTCTDTDGDGLLDHNPNRGVGYPNSVGENIFATTAAAVGSDAVNAWDGESSLYDYTTNYCDGEPDNINDLWYECGHYTQLVNAATTNLGCGRSNCPSLTYPNSIVCDYSVAGNFYDENGDFSRPYSTAAQVTTAAQGPVTTAAAGPVTTAALTTEAVTSFSLSTGSTTSQPPVGDCSTTGTCPPNSHCSMGSCLCNVGFTVQGQQCVSTSPSTSFAVRSQVPWYPLFLLFPIVRHIIYYIRI